MTKAEGNKAPVSGTDEAASSAPKQAAQQQGPGRPSRPAPVSVSMLAATDLDMPQAPIGAPTPAEAGPPKPQGSVKDAINQPRKVIDN